MWSSRDGWMLRQVPTVGDVCVSAPLQLQRQVGPSAKMLGRFAPNSGPPKRALLTATSSSAVAEGAAGWLAVPRRQRSCGKYDFICAGKGRPEGDWQRC